MRFCGGRHICQYRVALFCSPSPAGKGSGSDEFLLWLAGATSAGITQNKSIFGCGGLFFKKTFVDAAIKGGLDVITRLRDDAVLYYAPPPKSEGQIGRPKKYGDRFWALNP